MKYEEENLDTDKYLLPLKPCPWCKKTPEVYFPMENSYNTAGTWLWYIKCINYACSVNPRSPHIALRNKAKSDKEFLKKKIDQLKDIWNNSNDYDAYEGKLIDLDKVINEKSS